jgi:hypothetical protein
MRDVVPLSTGKYIYTHIYTYVLGYIYTYITEYVYAHIWTGAEIPAQFALE